MNSSKKIHFVTNIKVRLQKTNNCNLLMMEVKGYSNREQLGIARLEPADNEKMISADGFLELDFIIHPIKNSGLKKRNWDICPIFRFEEMPMKLLGVRVKAESNSEMILIKT